MFRTEQAYQEACNELMDQIEEGKIPNHSVSDAVRNLVSAMWESEWWQQKRTNVIKRTDTGENNEFKM
jgi:Arc/MetJ-type ribon-helix-helix transcriptional regulator